MTTGTRGANGGGRVRHATTREIDQEYIGSGIDRVESGNKKPMVLSKKQRDRLPSTLERSPTKAQETYMHTLEAAEETHGDGEAAHRIAIASLKHSFEKVGDHWEPKAVPGPSDDQDAKTGDEALDSTTPTAGGVDARATKAHLLVIARRLDVKGRSRMTKPQLVEAIDEQNRRLSARAVRT